MKTVLEAMEILREKGFDIGQAMEICADDSDLYMEVLETALEEGIRKISIIEKSINNKDYERYHIEVHALKNAARAIGAMELSEIAGKQEQLVKHGEFGKVCNGCGSLLEKYREVLNILQSIF